MNQPKERQAEKLKKPSVCHTGASNDCVLKNNGAIPRKSGFHSGIKFLGFSNKGTQVKTFSFDDRPKSEKASVHKEKEINARSSESQPKSVKATNAKKTEEKINFNSYPDTKKVQNIKKMELKPLYFDLCSEAGEVICRHEDGNTCASLLAKAFVDSISELPQSTPKSEKVQRTTVTVTNPFGFKVQQKTMKFPNVNETKNKLDFKTHKKTETIKTTKDENINRFRPKPEKVMKPNESLQEVKATGNDAPLQTEKDIRRTTNRAHSGIKFVPGTQAIAIKSFKFEKRSTTMKLKPENTEQEA